MVGNRWSSSDCGREPSEQSAVEKRLEAKQAAKEAVAAAAAARQTAKEELLSLCSGSGGGAGAHKRSQKKQGRRRQRRPRHIDVLRAKSSSASPAVLVVLVVDAIEPARLKYDRSDGCAIAQPSERQSRAVACGDRQQSAGQHVRWQAVVGRCRCWWSAPGQSEAQYSQNSNAWFGLRTTPRLEPE